MKHKVANSAKPFQVSLTVGQTRAARPQQQGFVLIAGLLILMLLSILQIAMMRSVRLEELMGGNTREKARALNTAQSALHYAEWWLLQTGNATSASFDCANAGVFATQICTNDVAISTATPPFSGRVDYRPSGWSNDQISATGGSGTYYQAPGLYLNFLYSTPDGSANFYKISTYGYGGNKNAVAVTQSVFEIDFTTNKAGNKITNLGVR